MPVATTIDTTLPPPWNVATMGNQPATDAERPRTLRPGLTGRMYLAGNSMTTSHLSSVCGVAWLVWTRSETVQTRDPRTRTGDGDRPDLGTHDVSPARDEVLTSFHPKTEFGRRLLALRKAYVEGGGRLLDRAALEAEIQERRGGVA